MTKPKTRLESRIISFLSEKYKGAFFFPHYLPFCGDKINFAFFCLCATIFCNFVYDPICVINCLAGRYFSFVIHRYLQKCT